MTVEGYLSQVELIDMKIENKLSEVYQLKQMAYSVSATNCDGNRVQSNSDKDRLGKTVTKIVDKEREIGAMVDKLFDIKSRIIAQLEGLETPVHYHILYGKYIAHKRTNDLIDEIHYSRSQYNRLYSAAIKEFDEKYRPEIIAYEYANRRSMSQNDTE